MLSASHLRVINASSWRCCPDGGCWRVWPVNCEHREARSMDDALQFLTQAILVLIGLLTTVDYLRTRTSRRLDAAFAFGSLGLVILLGLPNKFLTEPVRPLTILVSFL